MRRMTMDGFPTFSEDQVEALERLFPPRCLARGQTVENHLRYAGMVELIARMRNHVIMGASSNKITLTADEEAVLDAMAAEEARKQQAGEKNPGEL